MAGRPATLAGVVRRRICGAGFGVVRTGEQSAERSDGSQQEIEAAEERVVLFAEGLAAQAKLAELVLGEGGAPGEAGGDGGFEFLEMAGVEAGGFGGLDGRVDVPGFGPEGGLDGLEAGGGAAELLLPELHGAKNGGIAGLDQRPGENADGRRGGTGVDSGSGGGRSKRASARRGASRRSRKSQPMVSKDSER